MGKFQVFSKLTNAPMMGTDYVSCIPFDMIDAMNDGYYFRVLGKKMNSAQVKNTFRKRYPLAVKGIPIEDVGLIPDDILSDAGSPVQETERTSNRDSDTLTLSSSSSNGNTSALIVNSTSESTTSKANIKVAGKLSRQVRCIDTGEVFDNQSAAAKHFKIDPAQVSDSIKTGRPRSGYRFEKVVE